MLQNGMRKSRRGKNQQNVVHSLQFDSIQFESGPISLKNGARNQGVKSTSL